jgi:hypothetical protein
MEPGVPARRRAGTLRLVLVNLLILAPLWAVSYWIGANL